MVSIITTIPEFWSQTAAEVQMTKAWFKIFRVVLTVKQNIYCMDVAV